MTESAATDGGCGGGEGKQDIGVSEAEAAVGGVDSKPVGVKGFEDE